MSLPAIGPVAPVGPAGPTDPDTPLVPDVPEEPDVPEDPPLIVSTTVIFARSPCTVIPAGI